MFFKQVFNLKIFYVLKVKKYYKILKGIFMDIKVICFIVLFDI